jgi:hypothetical protein
MKEDNRRTSTLFKKNNFKNNAQMDMLRHHPIIALIGLSTCSFLTTLDLRVSSKVLDISLSSARIPSLEVELPTSGPDITAMSVTCVSQLGMEG